MTISSQSMSKGTKNTQDESNNMTMSTPKKVKKMINGVEYSLDYENVTSTFVPSPMNYMKGMSSSPPSFEKYMQYPDTRPQRSFLFCKQKNQWVPYNEEFAAKREYFIKRQRRSVPQTGRRPFQQSSSRRHGQQRVPSTHNSKYTSQHKPDRHSNHQPKKHEKRHASKSSNPTHKRVKQFVKPTVETASKPSPYMEAILQKPVVVAPKKVVKKKPAPQKKPASPPPPSWGGSTSFVDMLTKPEVKKATPPPSSMVVEEEEPKKDDLPVKKKSEPVFSPEHQKKTMPFNGTTTKKPSSTKSSHDPSKPFTFSVGTFNVLADSFHRNAVDKRYKEQLAAFEHQRFDILGLNEVTNPYLQMLLEQPWVRRYHVSTIKDFPTGLGSVLLSRFPLSNVTMKAFRCGPHLLPAYYGYIKLPTKHLCLFCLVHLKGYPQHRPLRVSQMNELVSLFSTIPHDALLMLGDMNIHQGEEHLVPSNLSDCWPTLHPTLPGYTFDPFTNPLIGELMPGADAPNRLDRILVKNLNCDSISMFAHEGIPQPDGSSLRLSDHYGLNATLHVPRSLPRQFSQHFKKYRPPPRQLSSSSTSSSSCPSSTITKTTTKNHVEDNQLSSPTLNPVESNDHVPA